MICNNTHLCRTRDNPCIDGPVWESLACYCDPLCELFGDCCIDYEETCLYSVYTEPATAETISSQTVVTDVDEGLEIEVVNYICNTLFYAQPVQTFGFWVISKCNANFGYNKRCEDKFSYPIETLDDEGFRWLYVPVTSANTGLAYKNMYCALCNREYGEFHSWRLKARGGLNNTRIPDEQPLESKLYLYLSSYNEVTWYPPSSVETKMVRSCIEHEESLCLGENLRDNGRNACGHLTAIVRYEIRFVKAICSGCDDFEKHKFKCSKRFPHYLHKNDFTGKLDAPDEDLDVLPISVLIDFSDSAKITINLPYVGKILIICEPDEVYISHLHRCIRLSCWQGLTLEGNKCVSAPSVDPYCPENVQEWSLELYSDDEFSCGGRIDQIFHCLHQSDIFVSMKEIIKLRFDGNRCRYTISVDVSMVPDTLDLYQALTPFVANPQSTVLNSIDDGCVVLNPLFYSSCKSTLEERCIGRLYTFPLNESHVIQFQEERYRYINQTQKFYPEEMVVTQITYDDNKSILSTLLACDGTPLTCPFVTLNKSLFTNIELTPGYIEYKPSGEIISPDMYMFASTGLIQVCSFFDSEGMYNITSTESFVTFSLNQTIVSTVCCCISLFSLLITFLTYARFRILHRCISNKLIMCLCVAIFMGQLMLLLLGQASHNFTLCTAVAALTHYIWLVAFALTFSLAYDLHRTFGSNSITRSSEDGAKVLLLYFFNSFGTPLLIVISCLAIQFQRNQPVIYARDGICWLSGSMPMILSFGVPIAVTLSLNSVLFVTTVIAIFRAKRLSRKILWHDLRKPTYTENLKELFIYFKVNLTIVFLLKSIHIRMPWLSINIDKYCVIQRTILIFKGY